MKENIKYFETLNDVNGYIINDIPFTGYIKENGLVIFNNDPNKMLIDLNGLVIIRDMVDAIFETLNDADGYIIETIPFSCYIKESQLLLECNQENCKIIIENGVAIITEMNDIIKYTATSKVTPFNLGSLPTIISNDFDQNTRKGIIKFSTDIISIGELAFENCFSLTSITIPNSVTSIGFEAFKKCTGLISINIPNSVISIGQLAFYGCSNLTSPVYNAHVFAFMPTSYSGAYTIPDGIESITSYAFYGCVDLTSIMIPNSIINIGYLAFTSCTGLTSVIIPDSVTNIDNSPFASCTGLTSVTIGNSVTSIGERAFYGCSNLTSISYTGTISQYNSINKGTYWHTKVPATQVYCLGENPPAYTPI